MGLRESFKKGGGGGFLNNVDGVIAGLSFTTEPDFGQKSSAAPKGDGTPLWAAVTAKVDGAEQPETTHLFVGYNGDDFVISEDGTTLTPANDGAALWGGTAFDQFYGSFVEAGGTDVDPGDDGSLNFSHVIGARVRFVQVKDEEAMKRAAKNHRTSKGKINEQGQKKGKDGKFYDIRTLQVEKVYEEGVATSKPTTKATAKPTAKTPVKPTAKPATKAAPAEDVSDFAIETLQAVLAKNETLPKNKLNLALTRALVNDSRRDAVLAYFKDEANIQVLAEAGEIEYENGVLSAVAVNA